MVFFNLSTDLLFSPIIIFNSGDVRLFSSQHAVLVLECSVLLLSGFCFQVSLLTSVFFNFFLSLILFVSLLRWTVSGFHDLGCPLLCKEEAVEATENAGSRGGLASWTKPAHVRPETSLWDRPVSPKKSHGPYSSSREGARGPVAPHGDAHEAFPSGPPQPLVPPLPQPSQGLPGSLTCSTDAINTPPILCFRKSLKCIYRLFPVLWVLPVIP